jgi:hypothetical protein
MTDAAADRMVREKRIVGRLRRLFKIERAGGFHRLPVATAQQLIERRTALVEELVLLEHGRRSAASSRFTEFEEALVELAREINLSLPLAQMQVDRLARDLRLRRGETLLTGIRDGANGRLLGKS